MPPKRMTANPVQPARYRPGKPTAPESPSSSSSSSSEDSDSEPEAAPPPKPVYIKKKRLPAPALRDVDLTARFDAAKREEEARVAAEAAAAAAAAGDDGYTTASSSSSSSDEEESEEEEEEEEGEGEEESQRKLHLRPTFLSKSLRTPKPTPTPTDGEEVRLRAEAAELLELRLKRDAEARAAGRKAWDDDDPTEGDNNIDDTDGLDPAAERAAWKLRELTRIQRERLALSALESERAEIERRREMDPTLRDREDLEFVREQRREKMENRGKMGFMQKFYHKGAFYQDAEILKKRDYATAEVEDRAKNRDVLPKYMQVRGDEVGKRGRTRWTHLAAEDTSLQAGSPWSEKKSSAGGGFGGSGAGTGGNRVPIPSGVDERFRPDPQGARGGPGLGERAGGREGSGGGERGDDGGGFGDGGGARSWRGERESRPRDHRDERRLREDSDRWSRWDDGSGRRPPDGPRRDRERGGARGGDSYIPGRDDDRERKRPHSPRGRNHDGEKRRRRDASPVG